MEEETKEEKLTKEEIKQKKYEEMKALSQETEKKWENSLKESKVIESPEFFLMKHYINMVVNGDETGCIILSRGGTGKTYTTLTELTKKGIAYAYMNSFSTPTMFYIWLYKNRNKIKILDDIHKLLESDKFSPFLKAILEGYNGRRIVFYNTTKPIEDSEGQYPPSFEENGGTIILTNRINTKNLHIDAILSRVPLCELNITNKRMLELMELVSAIPYKTLTLDENREVLEFCKEKLRNSIDLNLRTYNHARNFFIYAKKQNDMDLWGRLILQSLKKDDTDLVIMQVVADETYDTDEKKIEAINKQISNPISRATFYRKKKELFVSEK